jgi:glycosyltransferase involved in cell wall biosynthesis
MPVEGYAGLERVVEALVKCLVRKGIEVEIFGVKGKKSLFGAKVHGITEKEQFESILRPMYDYSLAIPCAHMLKSLRKIQEDGGFDIIHDHNYFIGPSMLANSAGCNGIPPAIHTIHGPQLTSKQHLKEGVFDNRNYWAALQGSANLFLVPISDAIKNAMPQELMGNMLTTVHNAVDVKTLPFVDRQGKKSYFITLARFCNDKGQHIAAKICARKGYRLRMAGTVATIGSTRKLMFEVANPLSRYRSDEDFKYYSDKVLPYLLRNPRITYSGAIGGRRKLTFLSEAKALLFPIQWDEPFGMSVIEALACGTPVVAMNRGAMPEIIEHGVTGFLANNEEEFAAYMKRVDEIDPKACRKAVEDKFSDDLMAERYIERYKEVIKRAGTKR